jgi:alpha-tubulin suppressor-like RCC1 family protein
MSKILRKVSKIFGSSAGTNQIAEFGSLAAGSPTFTTDPVVIQSLSNFLTGWFGAVVGANSPAIEDMNALCYLYAYQIAYLMQAGVPEYDATTTYYTGSLVNSAGSLYRSVVDNNTGNALSNSSYWALAAGLSPGVGSNGTITVNPSANPFYLVPSTSDGANIHVHTAQGPILIFLPSPALTEKLTIKDIDGFANINPITIVVCPSFAIGSNSGTFGNGLNSGYSSSATLVYPGLIFTTMAIGGSNLYGIDPGGNVWAAGSNSNGQIGEGDLLSKSVPILVAQGMSKIAAGSSQAYALNPTTGKMWSWGLNTNGQLGINSVLSASLPTVVVGTQFWAGVSAGSASGLFLHSSAVAYSVGSNTWGQLGQGSTTACSSPILVVGPNNVSVALAVAGQFHAGFITASGALYSFGQNTFGQMGDGTLISKSSPVLVIGSHNFKSFSMGDAHTIAIDQSGAAWAWGWNNNGQLGVGNTSTQSSPVLVLGSISWATVVAGAAFSFGLDVNGNYYEWGGGNLIFASSPVQVVAPTVPPSITALFGGGQANNGNNSFICNGGIYTLQGLKTNYPCQTPFGVWNVYSDGTNYWMR